MIRRAVTYFAQLVEVFGAGWTRFWFTPSDSTTLSLIRLLTGLIVVYLHATLSIDLVALFGADGLLPPREIARLDAHGFSYLNYLSAPIELWSVHLIGLAILSALTVGLWTRLTSVLSLLVFLSDVHRAPMITSRTDVVCAMLMLYLCIGESGARFSIDRILSRRNPRHSANPEGTLSTSTTIAIRLIQIHFALLVGMMGLSQLSGEPWWSGEGIWWLISRPESRLVDFTFLSTAPRFVAFLTHSLVYFELAFPILIWMPLAKPIMLAAGMVIWTFLALITGEVTLGLMMACASLSYVTPATLHA